MPPINNMLQVYIAAGFADDCDELIHRCAQIETLSYHAFCNIWKDMSFAGVFKGRHSGAEVAELSEELIYIAKSYMLADNANFEETVAGIFLVYALLNLQPYSKFAALRIVPDDVPIIKRIEATARREKRVEVLYILGSILIKGPCQMHVAQRERGMEAPIKKYLEGSEPEGRGARSRGVLRRQGAELSLARELVAVTARYHRAKLAIGFKGKMNPDINYTSDKVPEELYNSLKKVISGNIDDEEEAKTPSDHLKLVQEIKNRAMTGAVGPTKHVEGVKERKAMAIKSSSPEIKFSKGKVKTGNSTKTIPTSRKRKTSHKGGTKTKKTKRKSKYVESDSEEDDDLELPSSNSDDDLNDLDSEHDSNDGTDGVMDHNEETDVSITHNEKGVSEEIDLAVDHNTVPLDIDIESLPVLLSTPDGEYVEIQIVDESNNVNSDVNGKDNNVNDGSSKDKTEQFKDKSIEIEENCSKEDKSPKKASGRKKKEINKSLDLEKSDKNQETPTRVTRSRVKTLETDKNLEIIESIDMSKMIPEDIMNKCKLKRPEKRELKKPLMRSRFRRLGMLPVANFEETE